jgi:hypothetical protein
MVPATFPKGIRRSFGKPAMSNHRGRTWDAWDLTLPDGRVVNTWLDTSWGTRFHFEFEGRWYAGPIDDFKFERGRTAYIDLRDQAALTAFEETLKRYEQIMREGTSEEIEAMSGQVEQEAVECGFNDHRRLAALHSLAETMGSMEA